MTDRVAIRRLPTGVPGLDEILGGGLPEFSFNLIAGAPGAGKTTLAQQIMFALAGPDRPALYFTVVGEPPLKMLRYQQQFGFFDMSRINESIRYVNLSQEVVNGTLEKLLERIIREVEATSPGVVIVDSFRTVARAARAGNGDLDLQHFVQQLAVRLTSWQATTFLVGEYHSSEAAENPVFTVADGLLWLVQSLDRNSMVRKMQVMKMRGQAPIPGLHTFRITDDGVQVFPRVIVGPDAAGRSSVASAKGRSSKRLSVGVKSLDDMLGGGIPVGYSVLVAGPSGSGKSILAAEFIAEGARRDEPGIIAVFEKHPTAFAQHSTSDHRFERLVRDRKVAIIQTRPLDLSIDEMLHEIVSAIHRCKARRLVIDSLSGFELALAPTFREDFRESLYRMVTVLTGMGITMMMTAELEDSYTDLRFSPHGTAFLTDAIIMQRYVELKGQLQRVMAVVKVRGSGHSKDLRAFDISGEGIVMGRTLGEYEGLLTGSPDPVAGARPRAGRKKPLRGLAKRPARR
jgi:circadian clock protein KaiC